MMGEYPRWSTLETFCRTNPEVIVLLLADLDLYDYPLPDRVNYFCYRQWIWYLDWFIHSGQPVPTLAKNKKIAYKFSSLSFKQTQFRALVTAWLLNHAREQSIVSWHADADDDARYWVNTFRDNAMFADLDWSVLDQKWKIDNFQSSDNNPRDNLLDMSGPAFSSTLINLNNETSNFGWFSGSDGSQYNRPGPYLSEKTWKTLLSGCVPINSGQPGLYNWLENHYHIPCKWSIPTDYDQEIKDFSRGRKLVDTMHELLGKDLLSLIESNIEHCHSVQKQLLDPDYVKLIYSHNLRQDAKILDICHSG
jgi:hypothetical protein